MTMKHTAAAGVLAAALATVGLSAVDATPAHASGCTSYSTVQNADWLRVHTRPGTSTPVVGQLA